MKFYLSSYKIGNESEKLKQLIPGDNKKIGYIPNALDSKKNDFDWLSQHIKSDMESLEDIGLEVELLDLRTYFGKQNELRKKLEELGGIWISGGNVFILRQAMKISGLDSILQELKKRDDFLYAGYSAACCVLSSRLEAYKIVDDSTDTPYEELKKVLWDGLGLIDYIFLPHYSSDHSESKEINKELEYCINNKLLFKALRDGEVIIVEQ